MTYKDKKMEQEKKFSAVRASLQYVETDTKDSTPQESRVNTQSVDSCSDLFDSTSEGTESMLAQQIPLFPFFLATQLPSTSVHRAELLRAAEANDCETLRKLLCFTAGEVQPAVATALHAATQSGHTSAVETLLDYGTASDINVRNEQGRTPLFVACANDNMKLCQLLVRSGADIDAGDYENNTPLHMISHTGNLEFITWYLNKNPTVSLNMQGRSPVDCAPNKECRDALLKYYQSQRLDFAKTRATVHLVDFQVLQMLGKGTFGEVYLARKEDTQQLYAVKALLKEKMFRRNLIKYAMTERNVLSYFRHPFIVSLNYAFQTTDKLFLVLDYCPRGDLAKFLQTRKKFDEATARLYLTEVVLALEELHKRNIIYRDLKTDNIVIDEEGHALLTDFGLSREGVNSPTGASSFCGSMAYLAPEVIRRKGHGKPVDWYLLGVLFYELVVGVPPYYSLDQELLLHNIQKGKLRVPVLLSAEAKDLLKSLLQRNPLSRLGTCGDAAEVKNHEFFRGVDWQAVLRREQKMPLPGLTPLKANSLAGDLIFDMPTGLVDSRHQVQGWSFVDLD